MDPFFAHYKDQDSSSSAYSNIICWFATLALCPDVHCTVTIHIEAISDHRTLLCTKGQTVGKKTLAVFSYNHIYFYRRNAVKDAPGRRCPDVLGVTVTEDGRLAELRG